MAKDLPVVIHHNPHCGTSRSTLELIRASGLQPVVKEYLKTGWTRGELQRLLDRMGKRPRDILRTRGAPPEALALLTDDASDAVLLDAMTAFPILVERPIVETAKGVRLCRPAERVREIL